MSSLMHARTGVLLVNLGTPDSQKPADVKKYLLQFLTDARVTDLPWFKRQLLVRGIIVPKRYKESAKSYSRIWTEKGSPLLVLGKQVKALLQQSLGDHFQVELGMRYQNPSIESALLSLKQCFKLVVVPLFPQYASATTGSVHEEVMRVIGKWNRIPELQLINSFPVHPKMIEAFCVRASNFQLDSYDHILFSFHGLPEKQLRKADFYNHCLQSKECCATLNEKNGQCYSAQCYATAQAIVKKLNLPSTRYTLCYQSRLGKDPWIKPYVSDIIKELAQKGAKKLLVFSPSFVCDCLETIDEIGNEYLAEFKSYGGEALDLVPGLNDHPLWVETLKSLVS
ncbi:Ferrochelatase [Waddlia chondrophila 2032/99]|nr:ferrochelatase [Waddlia chondrophila]CCB90991.1 Ferrochelatase [Waddlia chondrophila 2032/99]